MLPTLQLFKIGVKLDMVETKKHDVKPSEVKKKLKKLILLQQKKIKNSLDNYKKILKL